MRNNLELAREIVQKAITMDSNDSRKRGKQNIILKKTAMHWCFFGMYYGYLHEYERSSKCFLLSLEMDRFYDKCAYAFGVMLCRAQKWEDSLKYLKQCMDARGLQFCLFFSLFFEVRLFGLGIGIRHYFMRGYRWN